ncbi:MAG: sulfotransferase [Pseudomonadota bacterium]
MLRRGADSRRKRLAYKVDTDVDVMRRIRQVFDSTLFQKHEQSTSPAGALFVLGLPRSGTTLVDRIVSSHSQVDSLGEINDFALTLTRLSGGIRKGGKLELVDASARFDFSRLGQVYMSALASYGRSAPHLINKTPQNYLYVGLIHLAIAGAKIIHLRRHPLDTCYAMYKTLFRMGYPFSYSLDDIGHYYLAYHQLMQHWRDTLPGVFLDVDYETIVAHKEKISRKIIQYTNLPWEDACLDFHKNRAPAATASATQVRQDIYGSSVGKWKAYEKELEPLASFLTKAGIECG